jgi:hypothetical protein
MKEQTAVEWFEDQVGHNSLMSLKEFNEIFEKAKEMEKDQIENAFNYGQLDLGMEADEYYNRTYNL